MYNGVKVSFQEVDWLYGQVVVAYIEESGQYEYVVRIPQTNTKLLNRMLNAK